MITWNTIALVDFLDHSKNDPLFEVEGEEEGKQQEEHFPPLPPFLA